MEVIKVERLIKHPKNTYYFDDMTGGKWEEFLESVNTSGVIEPVIITNDRVIVSGHQRVRACKQLRIDEIAYLMRDYESDDEILKELLETNMRQRGSIGDSDLKQGRRFIELERIYGIKNGRPEKFGNGCQVKTQPELASELGVSVKTMNNKKNLTKLIPELQLLFEKKELTTKVALAYSSLSHEDQLEIYNSLGDKIISEMTQVETKKYIEQVISLEKDNTTLQSKASELERQKELLRKQLEDERNKEPIKDEKLIYELNMIKKELDYKNKSYKVLLEKEKVNEELMARYQINSDEYKKLRREMELLTTKKEDLARSLNRNVSCNCKGSYL